MEQLKFAYHDIDNSEVLNFVKSNPLGLKLVSQLNLTDEEIINNFEAINKYCKTNQSCVNCKGMANCTHSTKGHVYNVFKDERGNIADSFSICDFYKIYYQRKKNLIFTTFDEEELLDEQFKSFFLDNANLLGKSFILKILSILRGNPINGAFVTLSNSKLRLKLIKSLANNLLESQKVSIVKFSDLLTILKSEFKVKGSTTLDTIMNSDVLILDGIGNEAITTWSRDEVLMSILDNRIQMDKKTILCSEFDLDSLKKLYKISYNDEAKANQIIEKFKEIDN